MIGVTGANGYVGGRILSHLRASGLEAIAFVRRPAPGAQESERRFALGEPLEGSLLDGVDTVVHAAYDLSRRGEEIREVNFAGSLPLLDGIAARGGRALLISSLSAFDGARSQYGATKLELERAVLERNGIVLRPGLVFGARAGGLFGAMVAALSRRAVAPLIGGGHQRLFLTHDEALSRLVADLLSNSAAGAGPMFAAHEVPSTLRAIATAIVSARGRALTVIPLPQALVALVLGCSEVAGVELPFRSDSLLSLAHPIPLDQVSALARSAVDFPPLEPQLWLG